MGFDFLFINTKMKAKVGYITCDVMLCWLSLRKCRNLKLPFWDWNSSASTTSLLRADRPRK